MRESWRALQKVETENAQGLLIREAIRHWEVMAQHSCYADSPDMSVPCADKGFTGMNAEDEWYCDSS